ncbi:hypothetical protein Rs2_16028 [Raphanus sativus]|nr:hypothetical protein Rs2_16028 [Raphanus sativus]
MPPRLAIFPFLLPTRIFRSRLERKQNGGVKGGQEEVCQERGAVTALGLRERGCARARAGREDMPALGWGESVSAQPRAGVEVVPILGRGETVCVHPRMGERPFPS